MDAGFAELYGAIHDLQIVTINTVTVTALLVYEIFLTSGQEIKYIWRTPCSFVNVTYVFIRYYALGFLLISTYASINARLSVQFCSHFNPYVIWGIIIFVPIADLLLILRIYALYHQSKKMALFVMVLWIAELVSSIIVIGLQFAPTGIAKPDPVPGVLPGCFSTLAPNSTMVVRSGALVTGFQAIYLGLTMYKLFTRVKASNYALTPLLKVFFRDGTGYCLIFFAMYLFVTLLFALGPEKLQGVGQLWMVVIVTITAGRLVLNLRDVADSEPDNIGETSVDRGGGTDRAQFSSVVDINGPWWLEEGERSSTHARATSAV